MTPPIVILGARGMLGRTWTAMSADWPAARTSAASLSRSDCDVADADALHHHLPKGVRIVINCAAYTDVDGAETNEPLATRLNADAPALIAERCRAIGALLVHYSTDYVFDGRAGGSGGSGGSGGAYRTDHPRAPVNAYGRGKALGEERIESSGCDYLIIRTSWLYAAHGKNFLRTIAGLALTRPVLKVVNDQRGRPTSTDSLVSATRRLVDAGARGMYHAADSGECTWFEFAARIAASVNPACRVEPCTTAEFPRPARRPANSVLDLSKTESLIGPLPHWTTTLEPVLRRVMEESAAAGARTA